MIGLVFLCTVIHVVDVDTWDCAGGTRIRAWAYNGVESGQSGFREARNYMRGLLPNGAELVCVYKGESGGRAVAWCRKTGLDLGEAAVSAGHASACPAFSTRYVPFEQPDRPPPAKFCEVKP